MSTRTVGRWARIKRGPRAEDPTGPSYRSRWERNYARYLDWLFMRCAISGWSYEPRTFWFDGIRRGVVSYLPDFAVEVNGHTEYVEVKGQWTARARTALRRMKKYHPNVRVTVVDAKAYRAIERSIGLSLPWWEK